MKHSGLLSLIILILILNTTLLRAKLCDATISGDFDVCAGDTVIYSAVFDTTITYVWNHSGGILIDSSLSNSITMVWPNAGVGTIWLGAFCDSSSDFSAVTISVAPPTEAVISVSDTNLCYGDSIELTAENLTIPGSSNTFTWRIKGDTAVVDTVDSILVSPEFITTYVVTVNFFGCEDQAEVTVVVHPEKPVITQYGDTLVSPFANTYQWNKDGIPIPGATNQSYVISKSGFYTVTVTDSVGCTATSDSIHFIASYIAQTPENAHFIFYPNPAKNKVSIELNRAYSDISIIVTNIHGQDLLTSSFNNRQIVDIDIDQLKAGIYFIQINSEDKAAVFKIIKG